MTSDIVSGGPLTNSIYITWIKDRGYNMPLPYSDIYFSYSPDNGATFSPPVIINDQGVGHDMGNMPIPAVAIDGTVYVVWMDYNVLTGGQGILYLDKSADGGITWGTDILITTISLPPLNLTDGLANPDALAKGGTPIVASPSNPLELYITYAADPDGAGFEEADIFFIKSTDGGLNWSAPLLVNHDDTSPCDQFLPWMAVKPDGTIDIAWYDRRNDSTDTLWEVFMTRSVDGGTSFSTNIPVTTLSSFPTPVTPGGPWMGEYLGFQQHWTKSTRDQLHFILIKMVLIIQICLKLR